MTCNLIHMQILKDWHLFAATMALTGITVVLLLLETSIPYLRGNVTKERDQEHPSGKTVCLPENFTILFVYLDFYLSIYMIIAIIIYVYSHTCTVSRSDTAVLCSSLL